MGVNEEFYDLIFRRKGEGEIAKAKAELDALYESAKRYDEQVEAGRIPEQMWEYQLGATAESIAKAKAQLEELEKAKVRFDQGASTTEAKTLDTGRAFLGLERSVLRATHSLEGLLRTLPGTIAALGGTTGVIAAVEGIGVAVDLLLPKIKEMVSEFWHTHGAIGSIENVLGYLNKKVDELSKKEWISGEESIKLENLRSQLDGIRSAMAEVDKLRTEQGAREKEVGATFGAALAGGGMTSREVKETLIAAERDRMMRESTTLRQLEAESKQVDLGMQRVQKMKKEAPWTPGLPEIELGYWEQQERLGKLISGEQEKIKRRGGEADLAVMKLVHEAEHGFGEAQLRAIDQIADRLQGVGQAGVARQLRGLAAGGPTKAEAEEAQKEQGRIWKQTHDEIERRETERQRLDRQREANAAEFARGMETAAQVRQAEVDRQARLASQGTMGLRVQRRVALGQSQEQIQKELAARAGVEPAVAEAMVRQAAEQVEGQRVGAGSMRAVATNLGRTIEERNRTEQHKANRDQQQAEKELLSGAIRAGQFGPLGMQFSPEMAEEAAAKAIKKMDLLGIGQADAAANQVTLETMNEIAVTSQILVNKIQTQENAIRAYGNYFRSLNATMGHTINGRQPHAMNQGR